MANTACHAKLQATKKMKKAILLFKWLLLSICLCAFIFGGEASQAASLRRLLKSRRTHRPPLAHSWAEPQTQQEQYSPVYIGAQEGSMQSDKISALPGQSSEVDFDHYAGYITVDPQAGRALFYYFAESPQNSSTNPLLLWLNGGPGCSSFGVGAMTELGPFRVNSDGKTLFRNNYAWNKVANVLFLESPAGVGFSYSNRSSDYENTGDASTANDAYTFLVNWLERFPQYKSRDFYITGESYAGHYVPQLACTILLNNQNTNQTVIYLKGIAIGNAWIDDATGYMGACDYLWTHALNSDETIIGIHTYCDFLTQNFTTECEHFLNQSREETGDIDDYNIYSPLCQNSTLNYNISPASVDNFDACWHQHVYNYLNTQEVQIALHANLTQWEVCSTGDAWTDSPTTILPIIKFLMTNDIRVWVYSGDTDAVVPVTSSRYSINTLHLAVKAAWRPWYTNQEVGGYVVGYEGMSFVTVRGAGHMVPRYQPERSLTMIASFLQGVLPPFR